MGLDEVKEWLHYCGRCNSCKFLYRDYRPSCPAFEHFGWETYTASGKVWLARDLAGGLYPWSESVVEKVFACTMCGNCSVQCQQEISNHHLDVFEALREEAVERGVGPMPAHLAFKDHVNATHNPYGEPHEGRFGQIPGRFFRPGARVAYFVGCTAAYRDFPLAAATVALLFKLGEDFTLVPDEWCCGSPLLTTGQRGAARELATHNVEAISRLGVERVVASCAGCFRTLKFQYEKKFGLELPFEVVHVTQHLTDRGALKRLKGLLRSAPRSPPLRVTYHDPCHLGRQGGVYDAPRKLLAALPGVELVEMGRTGENAWCCGAGAGVKSQFGEWALETGAERVAEAAEVPGVDALVTACPFCERNLSDAAASDKFRGADPPRVVDVVQLVLERAFPGTDPVDLLRGG
ncbi:MAG: (Fe-S)-binding protein [Promethearchaeota archaeon]